MLSFKDFSTALITSGDLDPDYIFLWNYFTENRAGLDERVDWISHKIFLYDTASEWRAIRRGEPVNNLPHGAERRKNKPNTERQLNAFLTHFNIHELANDYTTAAKQLKAWPGVGDWAAWKFCDLLERLTSYRMDFRNIDFRVAYSYPLRGLCAVGGYPDSFEPKLKDDAIFAELLDHAWKQFPWELDAPPLYDRKVNIQEFETCLCKFHSYLSGHYEIGKDTKHLIDRLEQEQIHVPEILRDCLKRAQNYTKSHILTLNL